jgi:hypothetical protein
MVLVTNLIAVMSKEVKEVMTTIAQLVLNNIIIH